MDSPHSGPAQRVRLSRHWRARALCATWIDPELFFPVGVGRAAADQEAEAKALCLVCPVMLPCRDWAQDVRGLEGVWGGRSQRDRELLRRTRRRDPDGPTAARPDSEHGRGRRDDEQNANAVPAAR